MGKLDVEEALWYGLRASNPDGSPDVPTRLAAVLAVWKYKRSLVHTHTFEQLTRQIARLDEVPPDAENIARQAWLKWGARVLLPDGEELDPAVVPLSRL